MGAVPNGSPLIFSRCPHRDVFLRAPPSPLLGVSEVWLLSLGGPETPQCPNGLFFCVLMMEKWRKMIIDARINKRRFRRRLTILHVRRQSAIYNKS